MTSLLICFSSISVMAYADPLQKQINEIMYDNGKTLKEVVNYTFDEEGNVIDVIKVEDSENIEKYVKAKILNEKESKDMETKMIKEATVTAKNNNVSDNVGIMAYGDIWAKRIWTSSWSEHLRTVRGGPGGVVSASVNESFATQYSCSVNISADIVERAIGVSITNTVSINQGYSHEISAGKYGSIRVYIDYNQDYFTVYREGLFGNVTEIGDGSYIHAVGASFFYYE